VGEIMTKAEFGKQFQRLRVAGYRLPVFDGVNIADVISEWYGTFGGCTEQEFAQAVDRLKQVKTDTFWPATGELWFYIKEVRKAHAIRRSASDHGGEWAMSEADADVFLAMLRATKDKILTKMAMPAAVPQVEPQAVTDARAIADEDTEASA
jgi:hypothetical protein